MTGARRVSIGTMAAIFGIAAALGVGYAAGAKPLKGHHAQCRSRSFKAKRAKRRAKCRKASKIPHAKTAPRHSGSPAEPESTAPAVAPPPAVPATTAPPPAAPASTTPTITAPAITPESARGFILPGIAVVSVFAEATSPRGISVSQEITEPHAVEELIDLAESLERLPPEHGTTRCRGAPGELKLELWFRASLQANPRAEVTVTASRCGIVYIRIGGATERATNPQTVISLTEGLLGTEL